MNDDREFTANPKKHTIELVDNKSNIVHTIDNQFDSYKVTNNNGSTTYEYEDTFAVVEVINDSLKSKE